MRKSALLSIKSLYLLSIRFQDPDPKYRRVANGRLSVRRHYCLKPKYRQARGGRKVRNEAKWINCMEVLYTGGTVFVFILSLR